MTNKGINNHDLPIVHPGCGSVMGEYRDGVEIFRGIPYGADCSGSARFLPPTAAPGWKGVRDCTANGPIAIQNGGSISGSQGLGAYFSGGEPEKFGVADEKQGENCLVLNVLTPDTNGRRPVLFYIHGGGFATGTGTLAIGADRFVREQDIVLVSVNHRLNVFGYIYLGSFDEKYALSGISGILDLVLALEWVRDNIAAFGGDPENVTIMGESGGAMKINMLLSMDKAKGLFHKAIIESGSSPAFTITKEQGTETALKLLERLGIPSDDLSALADIPAERILQAANEAPALNFSPVADGTVAKYNAEGRFHMENAGSDVPIMVGASEDEMAVFTAPGKKDSKNIVNDENIREYLLKNSGRSPLGGSILSEQNVDSVIATCREHNPKGDDADHLAMKITSGGGFLASGAFFQAMEKAALCTNPVYHYLIKYDAPHPTIPGARYSWHTADLPLQLRIVLHAESEPISLILSGMIASFARDGRPVCGELSWPEFTTEGRETMVFDDECRVEADPGRILRTALGLTK